MEMAKQLYKDLQTAQLSLVLLSHLHLLFLVTPYTMLDQVRFQQQIFCNVYMGLGQKEAQTARVLGVGEQCIAQMMIGRTIKGNLNQVVHRFYLSLILFDLWNGNSLWSVSKKYMLPRGLVHNLVVSAAAFSSSVVRFCEVGKHLFLVK
ncbi:hypothetical protein J6590_010473 [Homalodisca vitripennis]|nr:hypothetical protein J6590_010473 [Homalodisca vitripennis]